MLIYEKMKAKNGKHYTDEELDRMTPKELLDYYIELRQEYSKKFIHDDRIREGDLETLYQIDRKIQKRKRRLKHYGLD